MRSLVHILLAATALIALLACSRDRSPSNQAPTLSDLPSASPSPPVVPSSVAPDHASQVCPDPEHENWTRWDESETGTVLYVAQSESRMPAPIAWEPCSSGTALDVPCTREASLPPSTHTHVFGTAVDVSAAGTAVGVFGRRCPGWDFILLSELQGRVLTALGLRRTSEARRMQVREVTQGHWLAVTRGNGMHTVFGGELGMGLPKRIDTVRDESDTITAFASGEYIAVQKRDLLRWTGERIAAPWNGLMVTHQTLWGQYAFFNRWQAGQQVGMVWDARQGERALLGFSGTKLGRVVTDGTDLAFVASSSKGDFLAGAPFDGSTKELSVRRLATLGKNAGSPVVGCGMAALRTADNRATVVRIRDGQTWISTSREKCSLWCIDPLGINCQELIAESYGPEWTMVRIALDGLGEGRATTSTPMTLAKDVSRAPSP